MAKQIEITLENEQGVEETFKAGKVMARTTHDAMRMYSKMEQTDKDGKPLVDDVQSLDLMLEFVAESVFKREPKVTVDAILDGVEASELIDVLQGIIASVVGADEQDIKDAKEGK